MASTGELASRILNEVEDLITRANACEHFVDKAAALRDAATILVTLKGELPKPAVKATVRAKSAAGRKIPSGSTAARRR